MSTIYNGASQFQVLVTQGGLTSQGNWQIRLRNSSNGTLSTLGSNPTTEAQGDWTRSGSRIPGSNWATFESNQNGQVIDNHLAEIDVGGVFVQWIEINGYPTNAFDAGVQATLEVNTSPNEGAADFINPGLAEIVLNGLASDGGATDPYYVLLDNGTPIGGATLNSTNAGVPSYDYSGLTFSPASEVIFDNTSGSSWNVTGIAVRANGESGDKIMKDTSVSATVADGNSLTFSAIDLSVSGFG